MPLFLSTSSNFDRITIRTSGTFLGTATVRLAIYNNNSANPGTVNLDAGTVSCTASNTVYEITINQTLARGWYWLAANSTAAATTNNFLSVSDSAHKLYLGLDSLVNQGLSGMRQSVNVTSGFATASSPFYSNSVYAVALRKS
jgi:hypothetical protein